MLSIRKFDTSAGAPVRKEPMDQNTDIKLEAKRLRLLAAVLDLQHYTSTESNILPIPGGDRVIAIGTPAQVRVMLAGPPAKGGDIAFTNDGREPDWEAYAAAEQAPEQVDSEGGHRD